MPINSIKLVHMIIYRCQCRYGPNDLTNVVKDITNHNVCPKKLDIDGHQILATRIHEIPKENGVAL
jgi:hypothetical protein